MSDETAARLREERLAARAQELGITEDPPRLVRWILPEEIGATMAACLAEQGFEMKVSPDGTGVDGYVSPAQQAPFDRALFDCEARYSLDPRVETGVTPERLTITHEYINEFVVPCLQKNGYPQITPPPSLEVFIQETGYWPDYPFGDDAANAACPLNPPTRALLGEAY